jgi:NAD(P)-dependent dehydrogenase (short-subunit alcohol dehydrogenase family)
MRLKNRVAIVTGAGGGIGRAIAIRFSEEGALVVVNGRHEENITSVADEITEKGHKAIHMKADVSNSSAVKNMVNTIFEKFGKIDILVNNAAVLASSPIESINEEDWDKVMSTNLKSVFLCSKIVGQEMIKAMNGNIINIASIAAHQPYPLGGAYSTSKAGIFMFTKQLAIEWAKHNIRVNGISPGLIRTPMTETQYQHQETHEKRIQLVPLGRIGTPEDIANTAVFLASDESSYITGQSILVDGGLMDTICQYIPGRPAQT